LCFDKFRDWFLLVYHRFMRVLKKSNAAKPPNSIISLNSRVSVLLCFGFHDAIFRRIQKPVNL
jgi:hypothetical protein